MLKGEPSSKSKFSGRLKQAFQINPFLKKLLTRLLTDEEKPPHDAVTTVLHSSEATMHFTDGISVILNKMKDVNWQNILVFL